MGLAGMALSTFVGYLLTDRFETGRRWMRGADAQYTAAETLSRDGKDLILAGDDTSGQTKLTQAYGIYESLHKDGFAEGTLGIGLAHCHGFGVQQDQAAGKRLLREAAGKNPAFASIASDDRYCFGDLVSP